MIWEKTTIAEKIIKLLPKENIALNQKFNNKKTGIWFKDHKIIIEVDEGNHENYDWDDEKEREDMFKKHNFKIFRCNPNDPNFDLFKFLGEINLYVSELHEKIFVNGVISKITEDFEKIVAVIKLKELKRYAKNILPNDKKWKKLIKEIINIKYKNKMKIYCGKCKRDTENIDPKIVRTKNKRLIMQSQCSDCRNKKSRFIKEQEAKGILTELGIKAPLSKVPLLNILF